MQFEEIQNYIQGYKERGLKLFTSSSFQTHSTVLLHIISRIDNQIPVYFINTGYHFPETVAYRDQIADRFGLNLQIAESATPRYLQRDAEGRLMFTSDPDYCCYLNKVAPMEPVLAEHDVWINGVRADQSAVRKGFQVEQEAKNGVLRYHPMLDWDNRTIYQYIKEHDIPKHPLDAVGYKSIGCEPCTQKLSLEMMEREARWFGLNKVECGLNTELMK